MLGKLDIHRYKRKARSLYYTTSKKKWLKVGETLKCKILNPKTLSEDSRMLPDIDVGSEL